MQNEFILILIKYIKANQERNESEAEGIIKPVHIPHLAEQNAGAKHGNQRIQWIGHQGIFHPRLQMKLINLIENRR